METETFTIEQLTAFGNYMLSNSRENNLVNLENKRQVTHADFWNWFEGQKNKESKC
ncbi:hypothetical protein [Aquimarina algiphila]|uniref:hypothetical protein n=1 Tax=Aquimarina algiphila TaxID=2047982 RepID=UPI001431B517|nr:hypothetical protein [Aquimarina algiphila]